MDIATEIQQLRSQLSVLKRRQKLFELAQAVRIKRVAIGIGPVAIGTTDITITWPVPFADDQYWVGFIFRTGPAAIGALEGTVKAQSQTPSECVITVSATAAVATAVLDVLGIRP